MKALTDARKARIKARIKQIAKSPEPFSGAWLHEATQASASLIKQIETLRERLKKTRLRDNSYQTKRNARRALQMLQRSAEEAQEMLDAVREASGGKIQ
jgi:tellurite resistance protein